MIKLSKTKKIVYEINYKLSKSALVIQNFGNGSQRVSKSEYVIKPSGVNLDEVTEHDMSHIFIDDSSKNTGLKPSSDEPTHREIYKNSQFVGGIVHTHSQYATICPIHTRYKKLWNYTFRLCQKFNYLYKAIN